MVKNVESKDMNVGEGGQSQSCRRILQEGIKAWRRLHTPTRTSVMLFKLFVFLIVLMALLFVGITMQGGLFVAIVTMILNITLIVGPGYCLIKHLRMRRNKESAEEYVQKESFVKKILMKLWHIICVLTFFWWIALIFKIYPPLDSYILIFLSIIVLPYVVGIALRKKLGFIEGK